MRALKTQSADIFPFRYKRGQSKRDCILLFADIAKRSGLTLDESREERFQGFAEDDLSKFLTHLDPRVVRRLQCDGHLPLSKSRQRRMAQRVNLESTTTGMSGRSFQLHYCYRYPVYRIQR